MFPMGSRSRRASCRSGIGCNRTIIIANQDKNNYECPGKPLDFLAVFYLKKTDFRTVCNYFFPHIVSPGLPSRRSACWAIPTYAGFGATLPLIGRPTPRSEPRAGAPGRPFTTPSPPCALIPGSGPIRSAGRIPSRKRRPAPWRPGCSSSSPSPAATLNPTARGASAHAGRVSNAEGIKCPLQGARSRF